MTEKITVPNEDGPGLTIEYDPSVMSIGALGVGHSDSGGLKRTTITWVEFPKEGVAAADEAERRKRIQGLVSSFEKYEDAVEHAQGEIREWRESQDRWAAELVELHGGNVAVVAALLDVAESELRTRLEVVSSAEPTP